MISASEIEKAATNPELIDALNSLYAELDSRIAAHRPVCRNRTTCCKFDTFGHKLYVTTLELAFFRAHHADEISRTTIDSPPLAQCPYQVDGLCTTREGRPVGCRVFFCESKDESWQGEITEWALEQLRGIHSKFNVPYSYMEWTVGLAEIAERAASRQQ
jgi:hypothetical protein